MDLNKFGTNEEQIREFSDCLELINYRPSTLENYLKTINECMTWLQERHGIRLAEAEVKHLREFLLYLKNVRKLSPRSINVYNCSIKKYSAYVLQKPLSNLQLPTMKVDRHLPSVPSKADTFTIIRGMKNPKYKLILALAYGCALRIGEVVSLHYGDIYLETGKLRIREEVSKNRREGYVELPSRLKPLLIEYGKKYGKDCSREDYMFPGQKEGTHISKGSVAAVFKRRMEELGWSDRGYCMHSLRHSAALSYYLAGADLFQVKEFLRHNSINSTLVYIQLAAELKERKHVEKPINDTSYSL